MNDPHKVAAKHRVNAYFKIYTLVLMVTVIVLGVFFQQEIRNKFSSDNGKYIEIYFSVYGGLIGSIMNLLVYLPMTFRNLKHWSDEDREANFCWLLLRPLLGALAGFVSYAFIQALPIQMDMGESQRIFWFMFCVSVFAGFKSEDFILRFSQRFERLLPTAGEISKNEPPKNEILNQDRVISIRKKTRKMKI